MVGSFHDGRPRRERLRFRLILLAFTALVLITVDVRGDGGGPLAGIRGVVLDVLGPVRSLAGWAFGPLDRAWQGMTSYDELEAENIELRDRLAEVEASILQVGELERERQELMALLEARDTVASLPRVTARVIDAPVSNFERTIELDVGTRNGVERGMPVETGAGVLGRVVQVSTTRSRVELVTDPNFDVGVRLVRSGDLGSAEGTGHDQDLRVRFIDLDTVVLPGETVVTSGLDGRSQFPEGLLIGTVIDASPNAVQLTNDVTVRPAANLDRLRWVSVVIYRPDAPAPLIVDRVPEPPEPIGVGDPTQQPAVDGGTPTSSDEGEGQ